MTTRSARGTNMLQELFDKACAGVIAQGFRCVRDVERRSDRGYMHTEEVCQYRGVNGARCAAGFLIPDNIKVVEGRAFLDQDLSVQRAAGVKTKKQQQLVRLLQNAHDDPVGERDFVESFKKRAARIAYNFDLDDKVLL